VIDGLRPYSEYRDSGLVWLARLPAHWKTARARYLFREVDARSTTGRETRLSMSQRSGLVRSSELDERRLVSSTDIGGKLCRKDDLVLNRLKAHLGVFARAREAGLVSPDYTVLRSTGEHVCVPYFERLLRSPACRPELRQRSKGLVEGFWRLYTDDFYAIGLPVPPRQEQDAIVRFLAHVEARVRTAISSKQRLITGLEEQKNTLIHLSVTGALEGASNRKASGSRFVGTLPHEWRSLRLRHVADLRSSNVDKRSVPGEGAVRLCNYVDVYRNDTIRADMPFMAATATSAEVVRFGLRVGDVLITKDSEEWLDIGVPTLVESTAPDLVCGYHVAILRARPAIDPSFLFLCFQSRAISTQLSVSATGVTRYGLSQSAIKDVVVPVPPLEKQRQLVARVRAEAAELELGVERTRAEIALLREYQTRITAEVVSGALDVRGAAEHLPVPSLHQAARSVASADEGALDHVERAVEPEEVST